MSFMEPAIFEQIRRVYLLMAEAGYRPAAPSDGFGNITVPVQKLDIEQEARDFAARWSQDEDSQVYRLGCANFPFRPAMILALEAARLACGTTDSKPYLIRLLKLALKEAESLPDYPSPGQH